MSYIEQFEAELTKKLEDGTDNTKAIVLWASEKVLESYKHGIAAGQKGARMMRNPRGSSEKAK